jgi:hypothetical protein
MASTAATTNSSRGVGEMPPDMQDEAKLLEAIYAIPQIAKVTCRSAGNGGVDILVSY